MSRWLRASPCSSRPAAFILIKKLYNLDKISSIRRETSKQYHFGDAFPGSMRERFSCEAEVEVARQIVDNETLGEARELKLQIRLQHF